jgi:hypothetical protein
MINEDDFWSNWWNENWQGKPKYSEKNYPGATLSTTKSHMTDPVSNPGLQRWKPATNRLRYGAAFFSPISSPLTTRRVTVEVFDPTSTRLKKAVEISTGNWTRKHYAYSYCIHFTEQVGVEVALWTCTEVVFGSNLGRDTGCPD